MIEMKRDGSSTPAGATPLFAHLFASHPRREPSLLWLAGVLLSVPVVWSFFQQAMPAYDLPRAEWPRTIDPNGDNYFVHPIWSWPVELSERAGAGRQYKPAEFDPPQSVTAVELPGAAATGGAATAGAARGGSLLERLNPGPVTADLTAPVRPNAATRIETVNTRVATRLEAYNDSVLAERVAAKRAEDWTKVDASGRRWGITPGTLHAGGVALRLSIAVGDSIADVFQPPPGRREEAKARAQLWNEIQLQVRRAEVDALFNHRVEEIRQRKQSERKPGGSR